MANGTDATTSPFHLSDGFSLEFNGTFYYAGKHGTAAMSTTVIYDFPPPAQVTKNSQERMIFLRCQLMKDQAADTKSSS